MQFIKDSLIRLFIKFLQQERVQQQLNVDFQLRNKNVFTVTNSTTPYPEFIKDNVTTSDESIRLPIFISSRFRSGSTFLWNIFRHLENCTAYYEPFNERQWFDSSKRGDRVDNTHRGVENYWEEYQGMDDLGALYNEDWIRHALFMDEKSWDPRMKRYIDELICRAEGTALLQFNRIDFRLAWLRHHYPEGKFIHLYRHPRDQWVSFLTDKNLMNCHNVTETYIDGFYLDSWCQDLSKYFPFLLPTHSPHPYKRFYYLWKLSYLFGQHHSDISICFEQLVEEPKPVLTQMFNAIDWNQERLPWNDLLSLVQKPVIGKWRDYAPEDWYRDIELECEHVLDRFLDHPTPEFL